MSQAETDEVAAEGFERVLDVLVQHIAFLSARVAELEARVGLASMRPDDSGTVSDEGRARFIALQSEVMRMSERLGHQLSEAFAAEEADGDGAS